MPGTHISRVWPGRQRLARGVQAGAGRREQRRGRCGAGEAGDSGDTVGFSLRGKGNEHINQLSLL